MIFFLELMSFPSFSKMGVWFNMGLGTWKLDEAQQFSTKLVLPVLFVSCIFYYLTMVLLSEKNSDLDLANYLYFKIFFITL